MNLIDILKQEKGLSYADIAKKTGYSVAYIHMLAKGIRKNPSFEAIKRIAIALDEPIEKVFY